MAANNKTPIISAEWLHENLDTPKLILLDASVMPVGQSSPADLTTEFIPGSLLFDIENVFSDKKSTLPHSLLSAKEFQNKARALGINSNSIVIVYDSIGVYSAARAWWNFKVMGHEEVFVLNGGLTAWKERGLATTSEYQTSLNQGDFVAVFNAQLVAETYHVVGAIGHLNTHIIDLRSEGRFYGRAPEPRQGLRSGHIPSSCNIPYPSLLNGIFLKNTPELKAIFSSKQCDIDNQLVFSCGSGLTACIGILAAYCCGYTHLQLYDGSWSEWGADPSLPITLV